MMITQRIFHTHDGVEDESWIILFHPFPRCFFGFCFHGCIEVQSVLCRGVVLHRFDGCVVVAGCIDGAFDVWFGKGGCKR